LALGAAAPRRIGVADARDPAFAPEQRFDIAGTAGVLLDPLHV